MQHEEAMARESRASEKQQQSHALEAARLRMDAEAARFSMMKDLIDRLPGDQQSVAAARLLQLLIGATEEIANDARIDDARMLEPADGATSVPALADEAVAGYTTPAQPTVPPGVGMA
jgi:hypothetical protein